MGEETAKFAKKEKLDQIMNDLFRRAHKSNSKYPLVFVVEQIRKMSGIEPPAGLDRELVELRKLVGRFQGIFEHLKTRDTPGQDQHKDPKDDEESFQKYAAKHDVHKHTIELIAMAYLYSSREDTRLKNPLALIAEMIVCDPEYKILVQREKADLEKRQKICLQLSQRLLAEKPLSLDEIKDYSVKAVTKEHENKPKPL